MTEIQNHIVTRQPGKELPLADLGKQAQAALRNAGEDPKAMQAAVDSILDRANDLERGHKNIEAGKLRQLVLGYLEQQKTQGDADVLPVMPERYQQTYDSTFEKLKGLAKTDPKALAQQLTKLEQKRDQDIEAGKLSDSLALSDAIKDFHNWQASQTEVKQLEKVVLK